MAPPSTHSGEGLVADGITMVRVWERGSKCMARQEARTKRCSFIVISLVKIHVGSHENYLNPFQWQSPNNNPTNSLMAPPLKVLPTFTSPY
jgi:hypothetical protein